MEEDGGAEAGEEAGEEVEGWVGGCWWVGLGLGLLARWSWLCWLWRWGWAMRHYRLVRAMEGGGLLDCALCRGEELIKS